MKLNFKHHRILLLILFLFACEGTKTEDCATTEDGRGHVISVLPMGTISSNFLDDFLSDNNIDIGVKPTFDVKVYSIVYETVDWNGEPRQASGAIYVPDDDNPDMKYPLYSSQHGTESKRTNVASVAPLRGFDALFSASVGYIGISPDFLGLGISTDVFHPYIHRFVAEGVVDMIRATKNFACGNDIQLNDQLFLIGYSEGGYVTMATHKVIEESYSDEFTVTASAPMAGPHDILTQANWVLSLDSFSAPGYAGYVSKTYLAIYQWDRTYADYFQSPYAERMDDLFDGTKTIGTINDALANKITDLYQPQFLTDYFGDGEQDLKNAYIENSVYDWTPKAPIKLFHGDADEAVYYQCSVIARDKIKANGGDIELITIPGGTHGSSALVSYAGASLWFSTLKK